jgi:peptide/nickel transport system substrate-binding protein
MLKKLLLVVFTVVITGALLIGSCTGPEESTTPSTTQPMTSSTTEPTSSTTPTTEPTSGPQYGGTLRIIQGAEVDSFGWPSDQISPEDYFQRTPALETLVRYDEETNNPVPFLAESVIEDGDAMTVTFKLRKGIKFHDGTILDADACMWNLEQIWESPNLSPTWVGAESMEKLDDYTVQVTFHTWDNTFLRNLCWDAAMISPTAYEENGLDWIRNNPVGTGPFKAVSFQRDVQKVFEKFDDYWQEGKPYLDRIEIDIIADTTVQVASFLSGEHDILTGVNPVDAKTLESESGIVLTQGNVQGALISLVGDSIHPDSPFAKLEVRQAMSYAINKDEINDFVFHGYAMVASQTNSPVCFTHNPNVIGYPYNPDKARELLAQAGYEDGLTTTLWCRPDKIMRDMFTAVQGYLADVGIIADLQVLNIGQYAEMYWGTGWTDGVFASDMLSDPEVGIPARYFFEAASPLGMPQSIIHPDAVEDAIKRMTTATDLEVKKDAAWELQALMVDDYCMYTPLILEFSIAAKSTKVHGEYTSEPRSDVSGTWTFADAWLEQ